MTFRDELRAKLPKTTAAAANGTSRKSAIKLFCLECIGGRLQDVRDCTDHGCALYPYRPGASHAQTPHVTPGVSRVGGFKKRGEGQGSGVGE